MNITKLMKSMTSSIPISQLKPPRNVGMKKLDKSKFLVTRKVWALLLPEIRYVNEFLDRKTRTTPTSLVLNIPQQPSLVEFPKGTLSESLVEKLSDKNPKLKALLLREDIAVTEKDVDHTHEDDYKPELLKDKLTLQQYERLSDLGAVFKIYELKFDFDYWAYDDILKAILPDDLVEQCPSAFTIAGHLAHLNLKDQYMPYRHIIGEVILEKFPNIKTVVNKTNNITSEFRTFEMEVLAGEDDFVVTQKESGCQFTFDFKNVYWNSRLATEHERLINSFKAGEIVCDVMAGVGPFAVPAGKKSTLVFANDLNPEAYSYLQQNIKANKVDLFVQPSNLDGRKFIETSVQLISNFREKTPSVKYPVKVLNSGNKGKKSKSLEEQPNKKRTSKIDVPLFPSHYVMNLPDSAITFVNAYRGLYINSFNGKSKEEIKDLPGYKLPIINVHHFEKYKEEEIEGDVHTELEKRMHKKIVEQLGYDIPLEDVSFHVVRQVAPCKLMYCISFRLPEEVAFQS